MLFLTPKQIQKTVIPNFRKIKKHWCPVHMQDRTQPLGEVPIEAGAASLTGR